MSGPSLNLTSKVKSKLADSEARVLIGALLTVGFVAIQILVIYKVVDAEVYVVIMQWYVPIQAVVIGFYFGTPKPQPIEVHDNGVAEIQWVQELDNIKETQVMLASSVRALTESMKALAAKMEA